MKRILIVTGQSGSGKSSALQILEDSGYYCIDNLPLSLLPEIVEKLHQQQQVELLALGIDVRSTDSDFQSFPQVVQALQQYSTVNVLYFSAQDQELISRFSLSRRPHPLSQRCATLAECIEQEKHLLYQIQDVADLHIDSTGKSVHDLKQILLHKLGQSHDIVVILQSFGFKYGVPLDIDFVFDVRHLPNPHWNADLRPLTGLDAAVQQFLAQHCRVDEQVHDIQQFLNKWLPDFAENHRHYVTVSIGCTGGQHRSVYVVEQLKQALQTAWSVQVLHREQKHWHA
ncbi:MAG: RNase adapter RapZ [Acinetobacter sp.]|nr:RNase adapter RapZ [Acinetobacter sp.]